ncbi:hypothetical protein KTN05_06895 [Paracoccus sp. Z118]|nr:hypothetical protein [Paracoccus sp. Z118]
MVGYDGFMQFLDLRSFSSIWYWLLLTLAWTSAGRHVLGVPAEIVHRARRAAAEDGGDAGVLLLDWLSLMLPRWQVPPRDGAILLGVAAFVLTSLLVLGFGYGRELAQAAFLLLGPFAALLGLRVRLARRLAPVLAEAHEGRLDTAKAAGAAAAAMSRHRLQAAFLSIMAVAAAAIWGTGWVITHPYGL